jgi:hypothetical protein
VLTTADIAIGATIATLTSNQSAVKRAAHAEGWTGVDTTLRGTVATGTSTTGSPSVATTGTALVAGDLVIGSVSFENSAQMTADADTLNGTWDAIVGTFTTGGAAATNVGTGTQDKVVTATGAQTFNPTGGVADTVGLRLLPGPAPGPHDSPRRRTGSTQAGEQQHRTAVCADVETDRSCQRRHPPVPGAQERCDDGPHLHAGPDDPGDQDRGSRSGPVPEGPVLLPTRCAAVSHFLGSP